MTGTTKIELTPASAFNFLLGTWVLEREVSGLAQMVGELKVTATSDRTAVYEERARVRTLEGVRFAGAQQYMIRQQETGIGLCFATSGAVFQELRFSGRERDSLRAEAVHRCGEDLYASVYVLGPGRVFSVRHEVRGPRKAYVSVTNFSAV